MMRSRDPSGTAYHLVDHHHQEDLDAHTLSPDGFNPIHTVHDALDAPPPPPPPRYDDFLPPSSALDSSFAVEPFTTTTRATTTLHPRLSDQQHSPSEILYNNNNNNTQSRDPSSSTSSAPNHLNLHRVTSQPPAHSRPSRPEEDPIRPSRSHEESSSPVLPYDGSVRRERTHRDSVYPASTHRDSVRTVSRDGSCSLSHPTPDLQSLQGAYTGNIVRLEESAERLSMHSDLAESLRQLHHEQRLSESRQSSLRRATASSCPSRKFSASSASQSIISYNRAARSGGLITDPFVTSSFANTPNDDSPLGSVRSPPPWSQPSLTEEPENDMSPSQFHQRPEPEKEGLPLDSPVSPRAKLVVRNAASDEDLEEPVHPSPSVRDALLDDSRDDMYNISSHARPDSLSSQDRSYHASLPQTQDLDSNDAAAHTVQDLRPGSSGSGDTFRRAGNAFADFDGVHVLPESASVLGAQPASIQTFAEEMDSRLNTMQADLDPNQQNQDLLDTDASPALPESAVPAAPAAAQEASGTSEAPPGMVYYPAPVPMVLNLPAKLSKRPPASQVAQRKVEMLRAAATAEAHKSRPDLPGLDRQLDPQTRADAQRVSELPAQLRATMFFEQQPVPAQQNMEMIGGSATATLDAILDASMHAPVSAFTDHPIVGSAGADVYDQPGTNRRRNARIERRNRLTMQQGAQPRHSSVPLPDGSLAGLPADLDPSASHDDVLENPGFNDAASQPLDGQIPAETDELEDDLDEDFSDEDELDVGRPTTLLAEIDMRKEKQKQRRRTAANAFPNGMHATLLEMDAVAHLQRQARKTKQVTLAWEDPGTTHPDDDDENDNVPLGMLFSTSKAVRERTTGAPAVWDEDRPMGLLAQRAMEEDEPLSRRRARLRGEAVGPMQSVTATAAAARQSRLTLLRASTLHLDTFARASDPSLVPGGAPLPDGEVDDDEPLGQRMRRLKAQRGSVLDLPRPVSGDFASEVMSSMQLSGPESGDRSILASDPAKSKGSSMLTSDPAKARNSLLASHAGKDRRSLLASDLLGAKRSSPRPASHGRIETPPDVWPGNSTTPDPEETLGQRRRRLKAQMAEQTGTHPSGGSTRPASLMPSLDSSKRQSSAPATAPAEKRHSMAGLLATHPTGAPQVRDKHHVPGVSPAGLVGVGMSGMLDHRQSSQHMHLKSPSGLLPSPMPAGPTSNLLGMSGGSGLLGMAGGSSPNPLGMPFNPPSMRMAPVMNNVMPPTSQPYLAPGAYQPFTMPFASQPSAYPAHGPNAQAGQRASVQPGHHLPTFGMPSPFTQPSARHGMNTYVNPMAFAPAANKTALPAGFGNPMGFGNFASPGNPAGFGNMAPGFNLQMPMAAMGMNMGMNMDFGLKMPMGFNAGLDGPPLDAKQRASIDRWRQSVV